jgi:hypothetical protein
MLYRRGAYALLLLLFAIIAFVGCNDHDTNDNSKSPSTNPGATATASKPEQVIDPDNLFIVYSYDTNGKMETCGCSTKQLGGLSRRGTVIEEYASYNREMLVLDGGKILPDTSEFSRFKAQIILKMMGIMGYSALNIGCYEAAFGAEELGKWADQAKFPLVSSNVLVKGDAKQLVRPTALKTIDSTDYAGKLAANDYYEKTTGKKAEGKLNWLASPVVVIKKGSFKVGILGVADPEWVATVAGSDSNYVVLPMRDTLKHIVTELAEEADLWVAMVETDDTQRKELMTAIPEIKIWLSGNPRGGEASVRNEQSESGQFWQNICRDGKYVGITSVTRKEGSDFITQNQLDVKDTIVERADLLAVMTDEYRPELEKIYMHQAQPIGKEFVYAQECQKCHTDAFQIYYKSAHFNSLESLKTKGQNWNPDCVKCHIEFDELNDQQHPLQCTACHYQAWEGHIEDATKNAANVKPLDEKIDFEYCVKCHDPENSTEFAAKYEEYFAKIKHWDGPTVPGKESDSGSQSVVE